MLKQFWFISYQYYFEISLNLVYDNSINHDVDSR